LDYNAIPSIVGGFAWSIDKILPGKPWVVFAMFSVLLLMCFAFLWLAVIEEYEKKYPGVATPVIPPVTSPIAPSPSAPPSAPMVSIPKVSKKRPSGSAGIVVRNVRNAKVSGNIVRGFDIAYELENRGDLHAYNNQALTRHKTLQSSEKTE
jgi:hypothetical protein